MTAEAKAHVSYNPDHQTHSTRPIDPCEVSERVELIREALLASNISFDLVTPKFSDHPLIHMTHSEQMLETLKKFSSLAQPGDEIFTQFCADNSYSTPISRGTYEQALIAACASISASDSIKSGDTLLSFSLSRPPGHHAGYNFYHGFCFINNAAVAAKNLLEVSRKVAILDFDIHHPDGTQDIFYSSGDLLLLSLHSDPSTVFPMTGYANEQGEGKGKGLIVNIPLEIGISASAYKNSFKRAMGIIDDYNPDALVVSAGFDGHKEDYPPGGTKLTQLEVDDFGHLGHELGSLKVPACVVLEGGYNLDYLSQSVLVFFTSLNETLVKGKKTYGT